MKLYIIGINGISMQGIAKIMQEQGHKIYGYDDDLKRLAKFQYQNTIPEHTDLVIYSSAIKESHKLIKEAKIKQIEIIQRTDFFVKYMPFNKNTILIAGAHGKTTTSSIIAHMLGRKSYYLGGVINGETAPSKFSKEAKYTVVETDESDGSFIKWKGNYKILLNFDYEHMIFYKTKEEIIKYHYDFVMNNIENTKVIIYKEAKELLKIPNHPNIITYGKENTDYNCQNIEATKKGIKFDINNQKFEIPLLGLHNAYNFTSIFVLFELIKEPIEQIYTFKGVKKRMQEINYPDQNNSIEKKSEKKFYLDYGHHPTEIKSVINSLKAHFPQKKFDILFEPHKPSRILDTLNLWPEVFKEINIYLYPLFIADEKEINDKIWQFSTKKFYEFLKKHQINVILVKKDLSNLPKNRDLICFSAGKLSEILSKY